MQTLHATVHPQLLSKAERLFTGTLAGRIIEILQNARRAGAQKVRITNTDGRVTVADDGRGIEDFSSLLDLGRSGWDSDLAPVEDPAGVGIFCLSPREVQVRSGHHQIVIAGAGWTGDPVEVLTTDEYAAGTTLVFPDDAWTFEEVQRHAVFTGLIVFVDGRHCHSEPFVSQAAAAHPDLGCRIETCQRSALSDWHVHCKHSYYTDNVLVNFHGQVVAFTYIPMSEPLQFLVDLTGEPTGIRLMLPARTQLVENDALQRLKAVLEKEAYRYLQKRGSHTLKFPEYCRARELGIDLPPAQPVFQVGLLGGEPVEPVAVYKPDDLPLELCYRLSDACREADEANEANAHLLAALGRFDRPFVVVEIARDYEGYRWAKLPTVDRIELTVGKELNREYIWCEALVAVESLEITACTSDGKTFSSAVPLAVRLCERTIGTSRWLGTDVLVTLAAREALETTDIWYHLGGWSEDGDTYDTQLADFEEQLNLFWTEVVGPGEYLRGRLLDCLRDFHLRWRNISIESSGKVWITYEDGSAQMLQPPELSTLD